MEKVAEESVPAVVGEISQRFGTRFAVVRRLEGGYQSGAMLLESDRGTHFVLKVTKGVSRLAQLERVRPIVEKMRGRGYPMPDLLFFGTLDERSTYSVREFVTGAPMSSLDVGNAQLLLRLLEMQKSVDLRTDQDWSRWARKILTGAEENYLEALRSNPETSRLWDEIESAVMDHPLPMLPTTDMVHGDFRPSNVIVHKGRVSGVIDYEYAGKGSRVIDLATFLADEMVSNRDSELQGLLWREAIGMVGEEALLLVLLYQALEMIFWFITKRDEERLRGRVAQATWILERL